MCTGGGIEGGTIIGGGGPRKVGGGGIEGGGGIGGGGMGMLV